MSWCFCNHVADTSGDDSAYHGILKKRDSVYSDSDLVVILFQEHVTWNNIIGSIIIIVGISIHGMDEH